MCRAGETICEVSLEPSDLTIGVDAPTNGIIASKMVKVGKSVPVDTPIAIFVNNEDEYFAHLDDQRIASGEAEKSKITEDAIKESKKKPDTLVLMREIKHLIQTGHIPEGSGASLLFIVCKYLSDNNTFYPQRLPKNCSRWLARGIRTCWQYSKQASMAWRSIQIPLTSISSWRTRVK